MDDLAQNGCYGRETCKISASCPNQVSCYEEACEMLECCWGAINEIIERHLTGNDLTWAETMDLLEVNINF